MGYKNYSTSNQSLPNFDGKKKWFTIDWLMATAYVKQCQVEIAVAYKNGDMVKVEQLMRKLVNNYSRKRVAVKTQTTLT